VFLYPFSVFLFPLLCILALTACISLHPYLSFCTQLPVFLHPGWLPVPPSPPVFACFSPTLPVFLVPVGCLFTPLACPFRPLACHLTPFLLVFFYSLAWLLLPFACLFLPPLSYCPLSVLAATCLSFFTPLPVFLYPLFVSIFPLPCLSFYFPLTCLFTLPCLSF
jgi:hypothetical protein